MLLCLCCLTLCWWCWAHVRLIASRFREGTLDVNTVLSGMQSWNSVSSLQWDCKYAANTHLSSSAWCLLKAIASSNAFVHTRATYYLDRNNNGAGSEAAALEEHDIISSSPIGSPNLFITEHGQKLIHQCFAVSEPASTMLAARNVPLEDMTPMELMVKLQKKLWVDVVPKGRLPPHTSSPEAPKVYYQNRQTGGLSQQYLLALILADKLFSRGLKALYHCQVLAYYVYLLDESTNLKVVLPNQPSRYYVELANRGDAVPVKPKAQHIRLEDDMGYELSPTRTMLVITSISPNTCLNLHNHDNAKHNLCVMSLRLNTLGVSVWF
jgi:hypothetical protein